MDSIFIVLFFDFSPETIVTGVFSILVNIFISSIFAWFLSGLLFSPTVRGLVAWIILNFGWFGFTLISMYVLSVTVFP